MKKNLVGMILCAFFGVCCLIGFISSIGQNPQPTGIIGPVILMTVLFGMAVYNLVRCIKIDNAALVDKKTGEKIRFEPTAKTKGIWIDDTNKLWQIRFTAFPQTFHYCDLKDYKVVKETERTSSSSSQAHRTILGAQGSTYRVSGERMSYLALEIKLVNMRRFRWVLSVYRKHESLADAEDAAELLKYIKDNQ